MTNYQQGKMIADIVHLLSQSIPQNTSEVTRDGVNIGVPTDDSERSQFLKWLIKNNVGNPYDERQHYDYLRAFRDALGRTGGHFPDTYKLPGHETFSTESRYYKPGMPAGTWEGEQYRRLP